MEKLPAIQIGYPVFLADGADAFGAVRDIVPDGKPVLLCNIEGAGDVKIPLAAIVKVTSGRVVVAWDRLDEGIQDAIRHTLDREDFPPEDEPEVELEAASDESEDEDTRGLYDGPLVSSPPDELPGRDEGSRFFLPHHARKPEPTNRRREK
jgi:hypothetical protein